MASPSVQVDIDYTVFQAALNRATAEGKTIGQIIAELLTHHTEEVTTGSLTTHTVQHGDTLAKIALKCYGDEHKYPPIQRANNIADSGRIWVGQVLIIPPVADATPTGDLHLHRPPVFMCLGEHGQMKNFPHLYPQSPPSR
jgi:nucleoid-associated protein YgaU